MTHLEPQTTFQPDLLAGRVAFIAGGTSGINLGIAKRFVALGAKVVVLGRDPKKALDAAAEIEAAGGDAQCRAVTADVRDYAAVEGAFARASDVFGRIDILIAGQAGNFVAPALAMSTNGFRAVIDIDLVGTFNLFRAGFEHLSRPGASLLAITAGQAVKPTPMQAHVCAAKAGLNMLVKTLAVEWGPEGVRVNAISPGPIADTEGMARLASTPQAEEAIKRSAPLGRYGRKDEIGDVAAYLCSPAAAYITGAIFEIDGGTGVAGARAPS